MPKNRGFIRGQDVTTTTNSDIAFSFDRCRIFTRSWMAGLLIRLKRALLVRQQLHEFGMNEQIFPARLPFGKHADPHQFFR